MATKRQREVALGAAAVVAMTVAVLAYRSRTMAPEPAIASQATRPSPGPVADSAPSASKTASLVALDLASLHIPRGALLETVRDPFRLKPKPPPPATARPEMTQATGSMGPPPPPRIPLKFFMYEEIPGKGRLAGLSDARGVYTGFVGDTIEGRYRILQIGVESIDLAYLDGRGRQTIRLTGQ